jgi:hypothetical protein
MSFSLHIIGSMVENNSQKTFNSVLAFIISVGLLAILTEIQKFHKD